MTSTTASLLKPPFSINGVTFSDGDYITLSIAQPAWTNAASLRRLRLHYGGPAYRTASDGSDPRPGFTTDIVNYTAAFPDTSLLGNLFVAAGPYNYDVTPAALTKTGQMYNKTILLTKDVTAQDENVAKQTMYGKDAVAITTSVIEQSYYMYLYVNSYNYNTADWYRWAALNPSTSTSNPVTRAQNYLLNPDVNLCLEIHSNNYVAFRGNNGAYLHLVVPEIAPGSTYSGPKNSNYVLTYSNTLPSAASSAQWLIYATSQSASQVILFNRGTGTCLTLDPTNRCHAFYTFAKGFTTDTAPNAVNATDAVAVQYTQPTSRLVGNATLAQAQGAMGAACRFTLTRAANQPCNLSINPLSASCATAGVDPGKITSFCGSGDLTITPNCASWLRDNKGTTTSLVTNYCSANPDNVDFCGCVNTWSYRQVNDLLSYATPPSTILPKCNMTQCSTNPNAWMDTALFTTNCVQQTCLLSTFIDTVSSSEISKIAQGCNLSNTTVLK